jgi:hypothetical protein
VPTSNEVNNLSILPCRHGVEALRRTIQSSGPDAVGADDAHWRSCARLMCADARDRGVQVEQLLVSLKRIWPHIPGVDRMARDESHRLLSRIVSLCVEEYYAPLG